MDIAEIYPSAQVIGTDLSPIQPGGIPDNVEFIVDDALQEWTFPKSSHSTIKPGGQIEVSEARTQLCCDDDSFPEDSLCKIWMKEHQRLAAKCGFHFDVFPNFRDWVQDAGFTEIDTAEKIVPAGTWPRDRNLKRRGAFFMAQLLDFALDSYSVALFTRGGGWQDEDIRNLLSGVKDELRTNKMHLYTHL
ncbi:hypothetical protein FQN50_004618 [Emmonsiellopsis sp. PD_5]|nr:hypothetical protein FQN50_004618 [Emmonsiellopsis sp. PD_5]